MKKTLRVFLGRFAPIHKGHQRVIDKLVGKFGIKNCLIIIGSSASYNERTPYTLSDRVNIIKKLYPRINVTDLEDVNSKLKSFKNDTLDTWLQNLKRLERKLNAEFIFYAGGAKDVLMYKDQFQAEVLVDRKVEGLEISASEIRELLMKKNYKDLEKYLDKHIIPMAISGFEKFSESSEVS